MGTRRVLAALAVVLAGACGGGDGTTPDDDYSISISNSSSAVSFQAGGSATITVTVARGGGFTGTVSLAVEGLPAYVSATFAPAALSGGATSSILTLTADLAAALGTYRISVRASAAGVGDAVSPAVDCTITAAPGFDLVPGGTGVAAIRGTTGTVAIGLTRTGGFAGAVTLAVEGIPAGVAASFDPNPATGGQSTLALDIQATAAPGTYPLTIHGTATGALTRTATVTLTVYDEAMGGFDLALSMGTLAVARGGSGTITITVSRYGWFIGPVTLASEGQPAGAVPVFDINPVTGATATLNLVVSSQVPAGTYAMTIRGEASGAATKRIPLELRVDETLGFTITAGQTAVSLAPGTSPQVVGIIITRTGGFGGEVTLSVSGVPANVTGTLAPPSTTGSSAQLTLTALAGATPGTSTITVHATAPGMPDQTASINLTVLAAGTSMTWRFCDPVPAPVFFAYQDGVSAFVAVPPGGDGSYTITMAAGRGAVAFVQAGLPSTQGAGYTTTVQYATTAELQTMAQAHCPAPVVTRTLTGSVANVVGNAYMVALGGGMTVMFDAAVLAYTLTNVRPGVADLVAGSAQTVGEGAEPRRLIIRRDQNPPNGSAIPLLDFGAAEALTPASGTLTLAGLAAGTSADATITFSTANGTSALIGGLDEQAATNRTWFGVPAASLRSGDLHGIMVTAYPQSRDRFALLYTRDVGARTITFAAEPPQPGVSVYATTPVQRLRAAGTCGTVGSALSGLVTATFTQATRAWVLSVTQAYSGTSQNYDVRTLVLTNLAGWNEAAYGIAAGTEAQWTVRCTGQEAGSTPVDGLLAQAITFRGTLFP